jgi:hypothetical protein
MLEGLGSFFQGIALVGVSSAFVDATLLCMSHQKSLKSIVWDGKLMTNLNFISLKETHEAV